MIYDQSVTCQKRLFTNTPDGRLIAINADNGKLCTEFGNNGTVNLLEGLGNAPDPQYQLTSAPTVAGTTVVGGGCVTDNGKTDMPGAVFRSYDVITSAPRWAFCPPTPYQIPV